MRQPFDKHFFSRVNTRVTQVALLRLNQECERRGQMECACIPQGKILSELIMHHLPPCEEEGNASSKRIAPKAAVPAKRVPPRAAANKPKRAAAA